MSTPEPQHPEETVLPMPQGDRPFRLTLKGLAFAKRRHGVDVSLTDCYTVLDPFFSLSDDPDFQAAVDEQREKQSTGPAAYTEPDSPSDAAAGAAFDEVAEEQASSASRRRAIKQGSDAAMGWQEAVMLLGWVGCLPYEPSLDRDEFETAALFLEGEQEEAFNTTVVEACAAIFEDLPAASAEGVEEEDETAGKAP